MEEKVSDKNFIVFSHNECIAQMYILYILVQILREKSNY
jgi:hypothetical protein